MTPEEEKAALDIAWVKIREWVKDKCKFPNAVEIQFSSNSYHWTRLEVYPSGDCAVLSGSHGCESTPLMIHGEEEFDFGRPCEHQWRWYGNEEDFPERRKGTPGDPKYYPKYKSYWLLRRLVDDWQYVKGWLEKEIEKQRSLETFSA